jgi:hypothetical protein
MFRHRPCAAFFLALALPAAAAGADRLTDEQVKKLIEDIDQGYDSWKRGLEKENLDDAVITTADRSIKVKAFLKDFESDIDVVKGRFKPTHAASIEVLSLLRRGSDVELRNRRQGLTPSSEWSALGAKLSALAAAYAVGWPIESMNVQAVRLNDAELAARVQQMEKSAKQLRGQAEKAAKANKSIDKPARESLKGSIQQLESTAKNVRERIAGDRPATIEAGKLLAQTGSVKGTLDSLSLSATGAGAWPAIDAGAEAVARAFALPRP